MPVVKQKFTSAGFSVSANGLANKSAGRGKGQKTWEQLVRLIATVERILKEEKNAEKASCAIQYPI
jgi:hypothetical protein